MDIEYEIVKINYNHPKFMKDKVVSMIENGYMAIINVGPHPNIFSSVGHYIVITSLDKRNNEFYISNPDSKGDTQIDITFPYEQLVKDIYKDNFDFLMIRKKVEK